MTTTPKENPANPTIVTSIRPFGHAEGSALVNPNYRTNMSRSDCATVCCCFCGKRMSGQRIFAFLTNIGEFAVAEEWEGTSNDHLGLYPVGSDCAKLLKKHGVVLYDWECKRV